VAFATILYSQTLATCQATTSRKEMDAGMWDAEAAAGLDARAAVEKTQ